LRSKRETYLCLEPWRLYHWHETGYWQLESSANDPIHFQLHQSTDWTPSDEAFPVLAQRIPNSDGTSSYTVEIPAELLEHHPHHGANPRSTSTNTFEQHLKSIEKMDYYLLKNSVFSTNPTSVMATIQHEIHQGKIIYVVSDGSMNHQSLSFGWVIGSESGRKLAWGNGPGYGTNTSHRAEGWGQLAAAKFLLHLSRFTSIPYPSHSKVYSFSDNKGLITTLQRRTKYSKPYANSTLHDKR
jgi:hypothetical protein